MKRFLLLSAILTLFTAGALAEQPRQPQPQELQPQYAATEEALIRATGTAHALLPADIAVLTLGVRASDDTVTSAQEQAEQALQTVKAALVEKGVAEQDVQITYYGVETVYNYQYSKLGDKERPSGYCVDIDVSARLKDAGRVGEVIDAAVQCGAQSSYELTFESSLYQSEYSKALSDAAADAMSKAELLAQASGLTLNRLVSVTELQSGKDSGEPLTAETAVSPTHVQLRVDAAVEVCYTALP